MLHLRGWATECLETFCQYYNLPVVRELQRGSHLGIPVAVSLAGFFAFRRRRTGSDMGTLLDPIFRFFREP